MTSIIQVSENKKQLYVQICVSHNDLRFCYLYLTLRERIEGYCCFLFLIISFFSVYCLTRTVLN